jgi:hypothetical protein
MDNTLAEPRPEQPPEDTIGETSTEHPDPAGAAGKLWGGIVARTLPWLALTAILVAAVFGADPLSVRERLFGGQTPKAVRPAVSRVSAGDTTVPGATTTLPPKTIVRSYPWWQDITTFAGAGSSNPSTFSVDPGAIQWRVMYSCQAGQMTVTVAGEKTPLADVSCPQTGTVYETSTGAVKLQVAASAPWQLGISQQVDVPLVEPPTADMVASTTVAVDHGSLYGVDQSGSGKATFYRLADGSYVLRLDSFFITPNIDLELRLSPLPSPHSTSDYLSAQSVYVAPLDVTTGSINFTVPPGVSPTAYRSLVVWCPTITSAYAAATLVPGG